MSSRNSMTHLTGIRLDTFVDVGPEEIFFSQNLSPNSLDVVAVKSVTGSTIPIRAGSSKDRTVVLFQSFLVAHLQVYDSLLE